MGGRAKDEHKRRGTTKSETAQSISIASFLEDPFTAVDFEKEDVTEDTFEMEGADRDRGPRDEEEKTVAVEDEEEEDVDFDPTSLGRFASGSCCR